MKNISIALCILFLAVYSTGCKKCFHCTNACTLCERTISGHTFTKTLCTDSFSNTAAYKAAITQDSAIGYTCTSTASTYNYDYCANQSGSKSYLDYFNKGNRVTCNEK